MARIITAKRKPAGAQLKNLPIVRIFILNLTSGGFARRVGNTDHKKHKNDQKGTKGSFVQFESSYVLFVACSLLPDKAIKISFVLADCFHQFVVWKQFERNGDLPRFGRSPFRSNCFQTTN